MTSRSRLLAFALLALVLMATTGVVVWRSFEHSRVAMQAATDVDQTALHEVEAGPHVVFRSTGAGDKYGRVAVVGLGDLGGPRAFTDVSCDRVYSRAGTTACLRTNRGVVTTFEAVTYDARWTQTRSWPLPGIPSRTRVSGDGTLVATTSFVTGHSYASTGFSTETVVKRFDGTDFGNLEDFTLVVDGAPTAPVDRNVWGVTFVDDTSFYATVQSKALGATWLVKGDLAARTLTAVTEGVECPSVSPDGTRIAFKADVGAGGTTHWMPAVLDVRTGERTLLDSEQRSIDDQIEWLDDDTVLYGMPRDAQAGVTDVWALDVVGSPTPPRVAIQQAWSPSVVR